MGRNEGQRAISISGSSTGGVGGCRVRPGHSGHPGQRRRRLRSRPWLGCLRERTRGAVLKRECSRVAGTAWVPCRSLSTYVYADAAAHGHTHVDTHAMLLRPCVVAQARATTPRAKPRAVVAVAVAVTVPVSVAGVDPLPQANHSLDPRATPPAPQPGPRLPRLLPLLPPASSSHVAAPSTPLGR
jgi:hypothetical protein